MVAGQENKSLSPVLGEARAIETILVVDDSRAQLRILAAYLERSGYTVYTSRSGDEAFEKYIKLNPDLIISDWIMPNMSGIELCQHVRQQSKDKYCYFILLSSKSEKADIAEGLDNGADDFLTKPFAGDELIARVRAGERTLKMERVLTEKNRLLNSTLKEMSALYDALDRDLIEARKLQQSLVKDRYKEFPEAQISLLLHQSGHVGGDLVGYFPVNDDEFGVFSIDVSGHGVTSAIMTARLAGYFSGSTPDDNIAIIEKNGEIQPQTPSKIAKALNKLMFEELNTELYFTMILGFLNRKTGRFIMTQCGHPHPIIQSANGTARTFGEGGMPIGLIENAEFENITITLEPSDRLIILSDGVSECHDAQENLLEDDGLIAICNKLSTHKSHIFYEKLLIELNNFTGKNEFNDDISGILLEYTGLQEGP